MLTNNYQSSAVDYALRGLVGTDLLAFHAVAERINELKLAPKSVLDIGCGSGRSTRFLSGLGLTATGVDVSSSMITEAQKLDPSGRYEIYKAEDSLPFNDRSFELFFSSWVVLEQGTRRQLDKFMSEAARILMRGGIGFIVTNTPEFYRHRWVSCEVDFPENRYPLNSGQTVKARLLPEGVTVTDVFWSENDYREAIEQAGLSINSMQHPKALRIDGDWLDETKVAPYVIYEVRNR